MNFTPDEEISAYQFAPAFNGLRSIHEESTDYICYASFDKFHCFCGITRLGVPGLPARLNPALRADAEGIP